MFVIYDNSCVFDISRFLCQECNASVRDLSLFPFSFVNTEQTTPLSVSKEKLEQRRGNQNHPGVLELEWTPYAPEGRQLHHNTSLLPSVQVISQGVIVPSTLIHVYTRPVVRWTTELIEKNGVQVM